METLEKPPFLGADRVDFTTVRTGLGGIVWINIDYPDTLTAGLVVDKSLQLVESPVVGQPVQNLAFSLTFDSHSVPDSIEVFHNYTVSLIEWFNYSLAYPMVDVGHKPSLPTTCSFEFSSGRTSAFGLKLPSQPVEISKLSLNSLEELPIAGNCEVVDSDINTNSLACATINVNVSRNNDIQKQLSFPVDKLCRSYSPVEVSFEVSGNLNRDFESPTNGGKANHVRPEREGTSIIPNREIIANLWLGCILPHSLPCSDGFKHLISLVSATYHKLSRKLRELITNLSVGSIVELDLGFANRGAIANINNMSGRVGILSNSLKKNLIHRQLQFDCSTIFHISLSNLQFKYFSLESTGKVRKVKSEGVKRGNSSHG